MQFIEVQHFARKIPAIWQIWQKFTWLQKLQPNQKNGSIFAYFEGIINYPIMQM
jgi:hypothetical protein